MPQTKRDQRANEGAPNQKSAHMNRGKSAPPNPISGRVPAVNTRLYTALYTCGFILAVLMLMAGCAKPAPPPPLARHVAPASSLPTPPAQPPKLPLTFLGLQETWAQPCHLTDKGQKAETPCLLNAVDVASDGTVFVGGGAYANAELGGVQHAARAYQYILLAAFDPNGKTLWSKAFGARWHNVVADLSVIGDTLIVTGIHGNGFTLGNNIRLPDLKVPPSPNKRSDMGFEAETGFVAAFRKDGTPLWAKNLSSIVGPGAPGHYAGLAYDRSIFPARDRGFHVSWRENLTDGDPHIAHLDIDGTLIEHWTVPRAPFRQVDTSPPVDVDGNVFFTKRPDEKTTEVALFRIDKNKIQTVVASVSLLHPDAGRHPHTTLAHGGVRWRFLPDGELIMVLSLQEDKSARERQWLRIVRFDKAGKIVMDRELAETKMQDSTSSPELAVRGIDIAANGEVRVVADHRGPIVVNGHEIEQVQIHVPVVLPPTSPIILVLGERGAVTQSVSKLNPAPCMEYVPGRIFDPHFEGSALFFNVGKGIAGLKTSCKMGKPRDFSLIRMDIVPPP